MTKTFKTKTLHTFMALAVMVFAAFFMASNAYALCTSPAGGPGDITYNVNYNTMQYCDNASWIAMGPPGYNTYGGAIDNPEHVLNTNTFDSMTDVAMKGNYVLTATSLNDKFAAIDISDPANPFIAKETPISGANTNGRVLLNGNYAYLYDSSFQGIRIYDVTDPANFTTEGTVSNGATMSSLSNIGVVGNFVYGVSYGQDRFVILDVTNPAAPVERGNIVHATDLNQPYAVTADANFAYVTTNNATNGVLTVIDISDPDLPTIRSTTPFVSILSAQEMEIIGSTLYIISSNKDSFVTIDVTDPDAPVQRDAFIDGTNLNGPRDFTIIGNYAYVAGYQLFTVINISDPDNLTMAGTITDPIALDGVARISALGNQAVLISNNQPAFAIANISTPSAPTIANDNGASFAGNARGLAASNNHLFITSSDLLALSIIDVTTPDKPVVRSSTAASPFLSQPLDVALSGNYAIVTTTSDRVYVVDISDLDNPTIRGDVFSSTALDNPKALAVKGNFAYIAAEQDDMMSIVDFSDPDNPVVRGSLTSVNIDRPRGVGIHATTDYAYLVSDTSDTFIVIDVSDPDNPTEHAVLNLLNNPINPYSVAVDGDFVYFSDSDAIRVIDVSDPANPVQRSDFTAPQAGNNIALISPGFLVTRRASGSPGSVVTINATDPDNLAILGTEAMATGTSGVQGSKSAVVGDYYYYLGTDALYVVDIGTGSATCATPTGEQGDITYNQTDNVMQYCNGPGWVSMGPAGNGGAGCTTPTGTAGDITYNTIYNVMQYCEGDAWVGIGKTAIGPAEISNLALWLDASDTSTISDTAGSVTAWNDKSGNGNHAVQGTPALQPTTNSRTLNSLNSIDFDGIDDSMTLPAGLYTVPNGDNTVFLVMQWDTLVNGRTAYGSNAGGRHYYIRMNHVPWRIGYNSSAGQSTTAYQNFSDTSAPHVFLGYRDTQNHISVDGSSFSTGTSSGSVTQTENHLSRPGAEVDAAYAEVIVYNRALTTTEMNKIGNYLANKWGITWSDL